MSEDGLCPRCKQVLALDGMCLECPPGTEKLPPPPRTPAPNAVPRQVGGIMLLPPMAPPPPEPKAHNPLEFEAGPRDEATFHKVDGAHLELDKSRMAKRPSQTSSSVMPVQEGAPPARSAAPEGRKGLFSRIFGKG